MCGVNDGATRAAACDRKPINPRKNGRSVLSGNRRIFDKAILHIDIQQRCALWNERKIDHDRFLDLRPSTIERVNGPPSKKMERGCSNKIPASASAAFWGDSMTTEA